MSDEYSVLEIRHVCEADRVRVCVRGELDLAGGPSLTEALRTLRADRESVLLDLDELGFVDMSGLRVVLAAAAEASDQGQPFAVTPGSPPVRRLIALVGLDGRLPLERTLR